jgi:hypothetical protein
MQPSPRLTRPGINRLRTAYGMNASEDSPAFLLALNLELADDEAKAKPITPPGLPVPANEAAEIVSKGCIQALSQA